MESDTGLGNFRYLQNSIDDGDFFNGSGLRDLSAHAGTHVDSPGHFINVRRLWHAFKTSVVILRMVQRWSLM
jgi:hypothetical protein